MGGSLVTCRQPGLEPFAYLRDVLTHLPTHPRIRLWDLIPRGWHAVRSPAATSAATSP